MKKVLIVDDQPQVLRFMADLLEKQGHQVLTARDGLSALDILKTDTPDVIFVDLIMPNISGEKLCKIIRMIPRLNDIYIIILSGATAEQKLNLAEFGADLCIAKGRRDRMAKHVLAALDQADLKGSRGLKGKILGLEYIHPREMTKNLLSIKNHFEIVLSSMSDGILEVTPEARIVYANPSAISLIGIAEEKLLGSNLVKLFRDTDRQRIHHLLDAAMRRTPEATGDRDPVILNRRHVVLNVLTVKDEEHRSIVVLNDVTDRIRMEAQLRTAHKMEAVGTLAAGIAHGFNNLLMGIQGNVSLMLMDMDSTHPHYERLTSVEKQVRGGARLTSHLLGYARKGRYDVKPLDLNQLVEEISDTFSSTGNKIMIHRELSKDLFAIEADQGQLEQALLDLFGNAADAMPGGGDLVLETMNTTHEDMKGKGYDPKPGNYVLLRVTDTGTGMDQETMERIFDPFFTTKDMDRGTGLGLASVYGIIKGHGGYIDVESLKGRGTTFSIYLPRSEREIPRPDKPVEEIIRGTGTVLLVDDDEIILNVAQELLVALGYRVLVAMDGKEAIEVYRKNRDDINIVLLDMVMPTMGGGEAYDRLREINPHIKVLLSSGFSIDGEATEILERGCNGFIQKPFGINEMSEKIREILEMV